jgi:hypothetical protein
MFRDIRINHLFCRLFPVMYVAPVASFS